MKQLFITAALCAASIFAHAQASLINIQNNSNCDVHFLILGDVNPGCGTSYINPGPITLVPGGVLTYTIPTVPGGMHCPTCPPPVALVAGDFITGARIYDSNGGCVPFTFDLGEICTGLPQTLPYNAWTPACTSCGAVTATYIPANVIGGTAKLIFN